MAVVHPSRLALVPPDSHFQSDREQERERGREREPDRYRGRRDRDYRRDRERRSSPEYDDYKRSTTPPSTYPSRRERSHYYGGAPSSEYLDSRRTQRENAVAKVWPSSPKAPARLLPLKRSHKSKKHKRSRSFSPDASSTGDSSGEEQRRRRKEKKRRSKRDKDRERDRKRRRSHSRSRRHNESDESESESERERRSRKRRRNSKTKSEAPASPRSKSQDRETRSPSHQHEDESAAERFGDLSVSLQSTGAAAGPYVRQTSQSEDDIEDYDYDEDGGDDEIGPQPLVKANMSSSKRNDERAYGGALLRGEGSAMAAFLQEGGTDARIPRRGEIGLTSDQIASFESVGYVMSGSRHRRMNAVRLRKENQVINTEEKRSILKLQREERERREAILREEFTELVHEKLKAETRGRVTLER
ncbi:hypothetical protein AX15_003523 [Amanita polypyramis BW_CC]|nr:hypothetical protein AX15_003523 [Amanita polypyramis BW_CC]